MAGGGRESAAIVVQGAAHGSRDLRGGRSEGKGGGKIQGSPGPRGRPPWRCSATPWSSCTSCAMYNEAGVLLHKIPDQALPAAKLDRFAVHLMLATPQEDGADPLRSRQQALEMARKTVAGDSKEARDFLWLGQVAAIAKQMPEAEKAFRRACQLDAANPDTWVTSDSLSRAPTPNRPKSNSPTLTPTCRPTGAAGAVAGLRGAGEAGAGRDTVRSSAGSQTG